MSGFHTEWHHRESKSNKSTAEKTEQKVETKEIEKNDVAAKKEQLITTASKTENSSVADNTKIEKNKKVKKQPTEIEKEITTASKEEDLTASIVEEDTKALSLNEKVSSFNFDETEKFYSESAKKKKKKNLGKVAGVLGVMAWVFLIAAYISIFLPSTTFGVVLFLALTSNLLGLLAFIIGLIAIKKARKGKGRTGAILGISLGALFAIGFVVGIIAALVSLG